MILQSDITINGKPYSKGTYISPWKVYPFFLVHMLAFGVSGFAMAYFQEVSVSFLYMHGGVAIFIYLIFYSAIFGREEVKWMLINAILGIFGLYSEIGILLSFTGKTISNFPWYIHVVPFMYYVLYTFLIRQVVIEITGSRDDERRSKFVNYMYVLVSVIIYSVFYLFGN